MTTSLEIDEFITLSNVPLVDVRTPTEFAQGHVPSAVNLPLFSDAERAAVGTAYKQQSREQAVLIGLEFVGPKMRPILEQLQTLVHQEAAAVRLYCWRGGMRSASVAWLSEMSGYRAYTLRGGYKTFRNYTLALFEQPTPLRLLSGKTGSGKTEILQALSCLGHQVVDLEGLAHHKGSAFGSFGQSPQPTQQQFENELGWQWRTLCPTCPTWLEDESRRIGQLYLPPPLWARMSTAPTIFIDVPFEQRVERLVRDYGHHPTALLREAIVKIKKRLGGWQTQQAVNALEQGDLRSCCALLLEHYYDKAYVRSLENRASEQVQHITLIGADVTAHAQQLAEAVG